MQEVIRLGILFVLGSVVGGQLNRGIYRLAWHARPIGPWSAPDEAAPTRRWTDRIPIVGWLGLRRESPLHGPGYWIRPMAVELVAGAGLAALYAWEVSHRGTLPAQPALNVSPSVLQTQWLAHAVLLSLMIVASLIDVDEKTIPDAITFYGTLVALAFAAILPASLLPIVHAGRAFLPAGVAVAPHLGHLWLTAPNAWPGWLDGPAGLAVGAACYVAWCLGIWPRTWWTRSGMRKAVRLLLASMAKPPAGRRMLLTLAGGAAGLAGAWCWGGLHWRGLLTALVGAAFGGALIWIVRLVGGWALRTQAMGFGDVTLMAMIGAFLGWQSALIVFFLAPFAGLVLGLAQWLLTRENRIPYGPFLCAAAVAVLLRWAVIWQGWGEPIFSMGWIVAAIVAFCMVLMTVVLAAWRALSCALGR